LDNLLGQRLRRHSIEGKKRVYLGRRKEGRADRISEGLGFKGVADGAAKPEGQIEHFGRDRNPLESKKTPKKKTNQLDVRN